MATADDLPSQAALTGRQTRKIAKANDSSVVGMPQPACSPKPMRAPDCNEGRGSSPRANSPLISIGVNRERSQLPDV